MTVTYHLAKRSDIAALNTFRWQQAYRKYRYPRSAMRNFKTDFYYFLKDELTRTYQCLYAMENGEMIATIYWTVMENVITYRAPDQPRRLGYIRYLDLSEKADVTVADHLIDQVMQWAKEEKLWEVGTFYFDETAPCFAKKGFVPHQHDALVWKNPQFQPLWEG